MRKNATCAISFLLVGAVTGVIPGPAQACEPYMCWGTGLVPGDRATVPANLPALAWDPGTGSHSRETLVISRGEDELPISVENVEVDGDRYISVQPQGLKPGDSLNIRAPETCRWGPRGTPAALQVGPPAELPETLGRLEVTEDLIGPLVVGTSLGSCSTEITARQLVLTLQPTEAAQPWLDAMIFRTLVDGQPYRRSSSIGESPPFGSTWAGRGMERLYLDCNEKGHGFPGVTEGTHVVVFEGRIPGTERVLSSTPLTVALSCSADEPPPAQEADASQPEPATQERDDRESSPRCSASSTGGNVLLAWLGLLVVARTTRWPKPKGRDS